MEKIFEKYDISLGTEKDLEELGELYNLLNDYLKDTVNYPGWIKGIYPTRETAHDGIKAKSLFVMKLQNKIVASVILNHISEDAYSQGQWNNFIDYEKIIVVRTFVVHPSHLKKSLGKKMMNFIKEYSINIQMKIIRLDVSENNLPAVSLYEKSGYTYKGTVDFGLPYEHLKWFKLYELEL